MHGCENVAIADAARTELLLDHHAPLVVHDLPESKRRATAMPAVAATPSPDAQMLREVPPRLVGWAVAEAPGMSFRKILCPIDFSPTSDEALQVAARLATEQNAELVIAHAWYLPPAAFAGEYTYPAGMIRDILIDTEKNLAAAVTTARSLGASRVSSLVLEGQPWMTLVLQIENTKDIDLVVIGTHGRSGLSRFFLGSVAEMVVRHAPCSVLAVPTNGAKPFQRVLCPVDFSASSRRALDLAVDLARGPDSAITLLHVIEPPHVYSEEPLALQIDGGIVSRSQTLLDQWATDITASHRIKATAEIRIGRPGAEIRELIEQHGPFDLVAMGSHGRTGFRRFFLGSVAEKTLRHTHRAVLVARELRS
jgi:nucleotide-binding universal stress UspA family protein